MEKSNNDFDAELYSASIEFSHSPTPDKQPLLGAYFPEPQEKKEIIPRLILIRVTTILACALIMLMFAGLIYATTQR